MAPYHHFPDRNALLAAVATEGFSRLQRTKIATQAGHATAEEALIAGTANYVRFILENPNLYRLMKGPQFAERHRYPELHLAAAAPAETLVLLVASLLDQHRVQQPTAVQGSLMLWGLAHGPRKTTLRNAVTE